MSGIGQRDVADRGLSATYQPLIGPMPWGLVRKVVLPTAIRMGYSPA
jgi:hypothetical protein